MMQYTYKEVPWLSYSVAVIDDLIVGIENSDGSATFVSSEGHAERFFENLSRTDLINRSELIVDHVRGNRGEISTVNHTISAQTAAIRSTMTSLLLEAGRLKSNGIEFG